MSDCTCCEECRAFCESLETNDGDCTGCWCNINTWSDDNDDDGPAEESE